jgi:O-antigen/teichoic acid export membrane protein
MKLLSNPFNKNFALLFTGNSIGQLIPFLLAPFIARIYSPENFATQENFLSIVSMIAIVSAGRYDLALLLPAKNDDAKQLLSVSAIILCIIFFISLFIPLFSEEINNFYRNNLLDNVIIYIAPAILFLTLNSILSQWLLRNNKIKTLSISRIFQNLIQNGSYLLLGYLGWKESGLIYGWLIGIILPTIYIFIVSGNSIFPLNFNKKSALLQAKEHIDFPLINSIHAFTDIFATQFLIYWLITKNYGALYLGLFALMNRYLRAPINIISSALGQLYYKEASANKSNQQEVLYLFKKVLKIIALVSAFLLGIILLWGPDLFAIYLGEKWREAGVYAQIMVPAIFMNFLASVVSTSTLIFNKQKKAYLFSIIGYVLSFCVFIAGNYLNYDFKATLLAYSLCLAIYYGCLIIWYKHIIKLNYESIN